MFTERRLLARPWKFFSLFIIAAFIVSLIAPLPTQTAYALDIPQQLYPADYATTTILTDPPLGVPSFVWSAVVGATNYRLQVDTDIAFTTPITMDVTTNNSAYTPSQTAHLLADGEWYWRVRVEAPTPVGEWSPIFRFTKTWATVTNKPTPLAPDSDAVLAFFDSPVFSWTPVTGAAKYRFQIAVTQDGFSSPTVSLDTLSTSIQPRDRLANGIYYWRVVPIDTADHLGTPSDVQSFTLAYGTAMSDMVPELLAPDDESSPTFTPTFHWTAVEGAEHYRLEYTSDENCDFTLGTAVDTRQTYYTPVNTFPNDARYCWRVRVESGLAIGDWSQVWHFQKNWNLQPLLLTPTNLYQTGLYPVYSWTPVPGASYYNIQIATNPSFSPIFEEKNTANTVYTPQSIYSGNAYYYWRVRPVDGGGSYGLTSSVFEFQSSTASAAPIQIYPLYYYQPNNYGQYTMSPVEDRTVALPIFMWHRVLNPAPTGGVFADAYRIQVAQTPYFTTLAWEYDTENTIATPTLADNFIPATGQDYYWRVCPLDNLGGSCLINSASGLPWWSQIWKARFDANKVLPATSGESPALLRPAHGHESVEATPLLEWWPYLGATQYQVEISRDTSFSSIEASETVTLPSYAPPASLAQRSLERTDYGTFYWRVRAYVGASWGNWSPSRRFQVASQSEWRYTRTLGSLDNQLLIGDDTVGDTNANFDLTTLYVSQANTHWFLGFHANLSGDSSYVFYIDLDHVDGSGATTPPERPYTVSTIAAHRPEYAIYVDKIGGVVNAQNTWVFAWNGSAWGFGQKLADIGGSVYALDGHVELQLPNGAIGMSQVTSSASVMLFSVDPGSNLVADSVPTDPQAPGAAQLSRFSAVSERMNLVSPPSTATGDISTIPSILPFFWDWPTGAGLSTPFAGSILQAALDPNYTSPVATFQINSDTSHFSQHHITLLNDILGDNIYYWRVQPRYMSDPIAFGAWSGGWSVRRVGLTAQNLQTSITFATPSFSWDMTEGAHSYRLQVSTDPNFGTTAINQITPLNSYTPTATLAQGNYYWRVQVNRFSNVGNDWSEVEQFSLGLPLPTGLSPHNTVVHAAPTFCWDALVGYDPGNPAIPVLTAWKYRLQVSQDANFSNIYETVDTVNNCWTPTMGYHDGTYYWRLAMIDGNSRMGSYSPTATFTKQYPITTLVSPVSGAIPQTPTFIWTPVDGAASYRFEVSLFSTFYPLYDSADTFNTKFTPTKIYSNEVVYYWRVAIRDRDGRMGPYTDAVFIIGDRFQSYLPIIVK